MVGVIEEESGDTRSRSLILTYELKRRRDCCFVVRTARVRIYLRWYSSVQRRSQQAAVAHGIGPNDEL